MKSIVAGLMIIIGLVSLILSFLLTPVTTCTGLQGVNDCAPSYGSLIFYATISGAILVGGMYIMATPHKEKATGITVGT